MLPATKDLSLTPVYSKVMGDFQNKDDYLRKQGDRQNFSTKTLATAIAHGCSIPAIKEYLKAYPTAAVKLKINGLVKGRHPVLFYALERNDVDCVRLLLDNGADHHARDFYKVPAIAFAIMRSKWTVLNPVNVVKILLGYGADPTVIPRDMWEDYLEPPRNQLSLEDAKQIKGAASWCEASYRSILAETLNLSIRYFLYKASNLALTKARGMQLARAYSYTALLMVPYLVIGQSFACQYVIDHVTSHIAMRHKSPLVLTFAGLSGHGKTELATQMGALLNVEMTVIDCAQMRSDVSIFGSRSGYQGNERGSQLNDHLAKHDGIRNVVFLDEFDKTEQEVRNSLLLLLDSGHYHDRRTNKYVDASQTIWILATNLGDKAITKFYTNRMEGLNDSQKMKLSHKSIQSQLKNLFRDSFGAPMAGRMTNVAPFYPFDKGEQAVVTHKFLMDLGDRLRQPIDLSAANKRFTAHVHFSMKNDGGLCQHIAEERYNSAFGARSVRAAVADVETEFLKTFTDTHELIKEEMNDGPLLKYTVHLAPLTDDDDDDDDDNANEVGIVTVRDGFTDYYRGPAMPEEAVEDRSKKFGPFPAFDQFEAVNADSSDEDEVN